MDYFVVGLGNPGEKYKRTRHNVGWLILEKIFDDNWEDDKYLYAKYQTTMIEESRIHILEPQTFMNLSGTCVHALTKVYSTFSNDRLVVIHDDIDLVFGDIRISYGRGSGGHNGVRSIEQSLTTQNFIRIRIGIAKKLENGDVVKPAVLGIFSIDEYSHIQSTLAPQVYKILNAIFQDGYQKAMNTFNSKSSRVS